MTANEHARSEFSRAARGAFWSAVTSWVSGSSNELLSYEAVRKALPIKGQDYVGLQAVELNKIVGSVGRYEDFDRAFRPRGNHTAERWVRVEMAFKKNIELPPVQLYKVGDAYFVQDGNHRVSIAKQHNRETIDAFVTEVRVPVGLDETDTRESLTIRHENAELLENSGIQELRPDAALTISLPGECRRVLEHIDKHQVKLQTKQAGQVDYQDAVASWYDDVYLPIIEHIEIENLAARFPELTVTDLYVIVSEYRWLLQDAYGKDQYEATVGKQFKKAFPEWSAGKVVRDLNQAEWLDKLILVQEQEAFETRTGLRGKVELTLPGKYEFIIGQIRSHRWRKNEEQDLDLSFQAAAISWYDNVYGPLVELIESQDLLIQFPERKPADLYYWIVDRRESLAEELGWELTPQTVLRQVAEHTLHPGSEMEFCKDNLVAIGQDPKDWRALDQAIQIAIRSDGRVHGLYVLNDDQNMDQTERVRLQGRFEAQCRAAGVHGELEFETGGISQAINARARWVELIIIPLNHRPKVPGLFQIGSGIRRVIRRAGRPVMVIPEAISAMNNLLLAYDASPKSCQAMYFIDQMMSAWGADCSVISVENPDALQTASDYLKSHGHEITPVAAQGDVAEAILAQAETQRADLIAVGGFGHAAMLDFVWGSTVDQLMRESTIPLLILA